MTISREDRHVRCIHTLYLHRFLLYCLNAIRTRDKKKRQDARLLSWCVCEDKGMNISAEIEFACETHIYLLYVYKDAGAMSLKESNLQRRLYLREVKIRKRDCSLFAIAWNQKAIHFFFICVGATTHFLKAQVIYHAKNRWYDMSTVPVVNSSD